MLLAQARQARQATVLRQLQQGKTCLQAPEHFLGLPQQELLLFRSWLLGVVGMGPLEMGVGVSIKVAAVVAVGRRLTQIQ
jgi:hypothetical protein